MNEHLFISDESTSQLSAELSSSREGGVSSESSEFRNPQDFLNIVSGQVLAIDQFMLGNSQFIEKVSRALSSNSSNKGPYLATAACEVVQIFGGMVFEAPSGKYQIIRDSRHHLIMLVRDSALDKSDGEREIIDRWMDYRAREESLLGKISIDTRCVVLADASILGEEQTLQKFRDLRLNRQEKAARDYLREMGAAVRYGFSWKGEDLDLHGVDSLLEPSRGEKRDTSVAESRIYILQARRSRS